MAIELYRAYGHDLATTPLPFNVNNQHMNGGVAVDIWNESSLSGCFAIGEVAGTHGVTRPGGAALNAGQVGGLRAAEHIAARHHAQPAPDVPGQAIAQVAESIGLITAALERSEGLEVAEVRRDIQARMSDDAGFLCRVVDVPPARAAATALRERIWRTGFAVRRAAVVVDVFRWRHLALASEAVLVALDHYIAQGGGSRGARALLASDGAWVPVDRQGPVEVWRFRAENQELRAHKLIVQWSGEGFTITARALRGLDDLQGIYFEKNWPAYLTGQIHHGGFTH